jgi:hypothetical protein
MKKPDIKHFIFQKNTFQSTLESGYLLFIFLFSPILRGRWCNSDRTQEDLAKFGYMSERRVEQI